MMQRWGYANTIDGFLADAPEQIFGHITAQSMYADLISQKAAWLTEITALRAALPAWSGAPGRILFEYTIPRLGR